MPTDAPSALLDDFFVIDSVQQRALLLLLLIREEILERVIIDALAVARILFEKSAHGLGGGAPVPIGPDSVKHGRHPISPDGAWVALGGDHGITLISTSGAPARELASTIALEPLQFSDDGASLFVMPTYGYPRLLQRVDLATQAQQVQWTIDPPERPRIFDAAVTGDGATLVYTMSTEVSDLYVVSPASLRQ